MDQPEATMPEQAAAVMCLNRPVSTQCFPNSTSRTRQRSLQTFSPRRQRSLVMCHSRCTASFVLQVLLVALLAVSITQAQQGDECPRMWREYNNRCYRFSNDAKTVQLANMECQQDFASLVTVRTAGEHKFIQDVLEKIATTREVWFTGGYRAKDGTLRWEADASEIKSNFFRTQTDINARRDDANLNIPYNLIVYKFDKTNRTFVWDWGRLMVTGSFICQIDKSETWRIYQQRRDFSYGTGETDARMWRTGPNITLQSQNTLFFRMGGQMTPVVLDCQASGNPRPSYKWFRRRVGQRDRTEVTSALNLKYVITNGRLTISNPDPQEDSAMFTCEATNELGTVESNAIYLSYGNLDEFSNKPVSATPAKMYMGVEISCQEITSNTDLAYNWNRGNVRTFIRPASNPQYFLSKNGKLYISEVQAADQGDYRCMVEMVPQQQQVLAVNQAPSRTSMPIRVNVAGENANTYGPDIQDKFPLYFPTIPLVGDRVEIECLAYGRLPMHYSWRRDDGPMHPHAELADHNRRLIIPRARLEDSGAYTCMVKGSSNTANKTVYLSLKAKPSFPYPLQNQHVDKGSDLTWKCTAIGVPLPTYTWYKNGQPLRSSVDDGVMITSNILTIKQLDTKHEGMYQCEAKNDIGTTRSSAQLRTLSFAPTFRISPVDSSKHGAVGGDVTIACRPQAAPRANIRWEKNGADVGEVLPNGDLHLTALTLGNAGTYTCVATNELGEDRSNCVLTVQSESTFELRPADDDVMMNQTAVLPCKASFDRSKADIVYTWSFNSHVIDLEGRIDNRDRVTYSTPYANLEDGSLYITSAQYKHEGEYTCHVTSVTGSISASAYLSVIGPPGEPGGVHARGASTDKPFNGQLELWWQQGSHHGRDVSHYVIEFRSEFDGLDDWSVLSERVLHAETAIEEFPEWRGYWVTKGLSPGTPYNFRIRACSADAGCSPPSAGPYAYYSMAPAKPVFAPENVGGGGGTSGLLQLTWDPLPRSKWGGQKISYIVYYRKKDATSRYNQWQKKATQFPYYNTVVGLENFYLQYEVKVQAVNEKGEGPNSTISIAYSAEILPTIAPRFVAANAINSTAGIVEWQAIPNTREDAHGTIGGYQINYWEEGNTLCDGLYEGDAQSINIYGDQTEGMLIGMNPGGDYCVNIQLYNAAGMGPKTDAYYLGMNDLPPVRYPEYVVVTSHGWDSVRLLWDGVYNDFLQEPIRGYKAWWWEINEDIRSARVEDFGKTFTGVLHGVERGYLYRLRMMAYSNGGDGAKSADIYFTLGGQVRYDPLSMEIMNSSPSLLRFTAHALIVWSIFITIIIHRIHRL